MSSTETKWTPGSWHIVPYGHGDSLVICTAPDGNSRICFMATPGRSPGAMEMIEADARLIAAAPELYEALELAREYVAEERENLIDNSCPKDADGQPIIDRIDVYSRDDLAHDDAMLVVIDAALAKARGEQP